MCKPVIEVRRSLYSTWQVIRRNAPGTTDGWITETLFETANKVKAQGVKEYLETR